MTDRPFLLAQISDLHITDHPGSKTPDAAERLVRVLAAMAVHRPDAILATGDLVDRGGAQEYRLLAAALSDAPAPVFLLPGNHDDAAALRRAFPDHAYLPEQPPLCFTLEHMPLRIVAVDQTFPGLEGGLFMPEHAEWMHAALSADPAAPTIVALHHPPFLTHTAVDRIGLDGADLFEAVIARHPQVRRIVCGHLHRAIIGRVAHADVMTCPSTARAFAPNFDEDKAVLADDPPGYLLHAWRPRDGLATYVMSA